ncbi:unnamed protein product [Paramecium primaurelia]|uniref:WD-40 repeat protein n=1 Tax=Paramecium primaurelia TaxID=5886 RepID=A0A8S1NV71_PARPR|nr:unnamed protein product [Paramecium primaurelia]
MQGCFQAKESLTDIFDQIKDVDQQIFGVILEILRKEKVQDLIGFLSDFGNQRLLESSIQQQGEKLKLRDKQQKWSVGRKDLEQISNVLRKLKDHEFNYKDFSSEENEESTLSLINTIKDNSKIIDLLQFLVHLTSIDESIIQGGSNSLHLLVQMKVDLSEINFNNIKIQNTSLVGGNFVRCNFSGSQFNNINISGINLNGAQLFDCIWKDLRIHELHKFNGHTGAVQSVCFSPDGNKLASGSDDSSIRIWDVKTGQQSQLDGHDYCINSVCFSPDGNTLASGSADWFVFLWDSKTRKIKAKLNGHTGSVQSVCFSPDGNTLVSGSIDNSIRLWDVGTGLQKVQLDGHDDAVTSICFSPDGNILASSSYDLSIRLWDVKTGQQKAKLDGHTSTVYSVCFSPDGKTLASGSNDKSIRLWDVQEENQISSTDKQQKDILAELKTPLFFNNLLQESKNITILRISKTPLFQAQGALIMKGDFIDYQGYDLRQLLKSKGCCFQEDFKQKQFFFNITIIIKFITRVFINYFFIRFYYSSSLLGNIFWDFIKTVIDQN